MSYNSIKKLSCTEDLPEEQQKNILQLGEKTLAKKINDLPEEQQKNILQLSVENLELLNQLANSSESTHFTSELINVIASTPNINDAKLRSLLRKLLEGRLNTNLHKYVTKETLQEYFETTNELSEDFCNKKFEKLRFIAKKSEKKIAMLIAKIKEEIAKHPDKDSTKIEKAIDSLRHDSQNEELLEKCLSYFCATLTLYRHTEGLDIEKMFNSVIGFVKKGNEEITRLLIVSRKCGNDNKLPDDQKAKDMRYLYTNPQFAQQYYAMLYGDDVEFNEFLTRCPNAPQSSTAEESQKLPISPASIVNEAYMAILIAKEQNSKNFDNERIQHNDGTELIKKLSKKVKYDYIKKIVDLLSSKDILIEEIFDKVTEAEVSFDQLYNFYVFLESSGALYYSNAYRCIENLDRLTSLLEIEKYNYESKTIDYVIDKLLFLDSATDEINEVIQHNRTKKPGIIEQTLGAASKTVQGAAGVVSENAQGFAGSASKTVQGAAGAVSETVGGVCNYVVGLFAKPKQGKTRQNQELVEAVKKHLPK